MRLFLSILFSLVVYLNTFSQQGCSISPDTRPLPQLLYKNDDKLLVFNCKVISSYVTESGGAYSIAEIKEIYFGKTNLKKVRLWTGNVAPILPPLLLRRQPQPKKQEIKKDFNLDYGLIDEESFVITCGGGYWGIKMPVDSSYIIYTNIDTSYNQDYIGRSKQLKQTPEVKKEVETLKYFTTIFKDKKSVDYILKDLKNNVLAIGAYKKGKPYGVWKLFDEKGKLVSWEDFRGNIYKVFYLNGNLSLKITQYKDSCLTEHFFDLPTTQLSSKIMEIKNDSGSHSFITEYDKDGYMLTKYEELTNKMTRYNGLYYEYYKNGKIKTISEYKFSGLNYRNGIYKEFYPSGNVKLDAHIINARRVGCWTWYNDDGSFWAENDYTDGKAPQ